MQMIQLQVSVHPGEILKEEFLLPLDLSAGRLARHIHVPRTRIERLIKGETAMTIDTAARLARAFGTTPQFWMNLQLAHDLLTAPPLDVDTITPLVSA
jgi:addiction module HigA family antidote